MAEEINVQEIMQNIRDEIKEKGYTEDMLSFNDSMDAMKKANGYDENQFVRALTYMNLNFRISYYRKIVGGFFKKFCVKFVRKLIKPTVFPVVEEQNQLNEAFVQTINMLKERIVILEKEVAELEKCKK